MCATKYEWAPNAGTEVLIPVKVPTSFKANEWMKNWSELDAPMRILIEW